ncbi:hypothetical protein BZA70DRAFT_12053 [Myxozyma melibiosi]|uniref:Secreted peptide n=1 Tax=Myxozyma melibiosi TaxID=54550 RepID=A0ABR1FC05_9ASCO
MSLLHSLCRACLFFATHAVTCFACQLFTTTHTTRSSDNFVRSAALLLSLTHPPASLLSLLSWHLLSRRSSAGLALALALFLPSALCAL